MIGYWRRPVRDEKLESVLPVHVRPKSFAEASFDSLNNVPNQTSASNATKLAHALVSLETLGRQNLRASMQASLYALSHTAWHSMP